MGKQRKGSIVERAGKFYVRIVYTDDLGKRRELMRRAQNKKHAKELQKQLVKQLASAVLKAKPRYSSIKRAQALFAVAIDTGLRFGELVSICRSDIDAFSMLLTVYGKAGERRVPISATALRWINRQLQTHTHDRLFATNAGTLWDHANAQRALKSLFELAGVPEDLAEFHHVRRYALRQYVEKAGLRGAQLLAGHASPQTTIKPACVREKLKPGAKSKERCGPFKRKKSKLNGSGYYHPAC
jgi:integrase